MSTEAVDVLIVGGGPSGLAAATELARDGSLHVMLLEREPDTGGVPRHCGHYPFGLREMHRLLQGPDYARRLSDLAREAGVEIRTGTSVMRIEQGPSLHISSNAGTARIHARRILICTGMRERSRVERRIGGTRPGGVMSTAALQGLVYLDALRPFSRPVIYGSELVSFSAIMTCRHLGMQPIAMIEPEARVRACWPSSWFPRLHGIPLYTSTDIVSIVGRERVSGVQLRHDNGAIRDLDCDGVIVSGRFRPEATLVAESHLTLDRGSLGPLVDSVGRCSDPDYFAAGNVRGDARSAGRCWHDGRAVARNMRRSLEGTLPEAEPASASRADVQ